MDERYRRLAEAAGRVLENEPMSRHTTFRVGGPADLMIEAADAESLARMIRICREDGLPFFILGKGSNLLVGDGGYRGVIFHIGEAMSRIGRIGETALCAGAGVTLAAIASYARTCGLSGLEFAGGIPGSLGGALAMNAGAYGGEMKDVVSEAQVLFPDGTVSWLPVHELAMGYRTSRIQREGLIALAARFALTPAPAEEIAARMNDLAARRRSRQPLEYPSAGSTFKRPEGYFAGKLIQDAGLSGYTVGGACVSEKHCGFVINRDHASAADILAVCRHVSEEVAKQFGVTLEMEVRQLGDF